MRDYPRQLEILINELSKLPGVGEKSAQRLAFHILDKDEKQVEALAESMLNAKRQLKHSDSTILVPPASSVPNLIAYLLRVLRPDISYTCAQV